MQICNVTLNDVRIEKFPRDKRVELFNYDFTPISCLKLRLGDLYIYSETFPTQGAKRYLAERGVFL